MKKDIFVTFSGQIGRLLFATIASALLARGLGADQRGLYALAIWGPNLMGMFVPLGQVEINQTYAGLQKEYRSQLLIHSLCIALAVGFVIGGVYIAIFSTHASILGKYSQLTPDIIYVGAILQILLALNLMLRGLTLGSEYIQSTVVISNSGFFLQAVLFGIFIFYLKLGVFSAMLILLVVNIVTITGFFFRLKKYFYEIIKGNVKFSVEFFNDCKKVGMQYLMCSMVISFDVFLPVFILASLGASNVEIGIFSVGFALAQQIEMIPMSISQVFLPRLSNSKEKYENETPQIFRITMIASLFSMIFVIIAGFPLIYILFGKEFSSCFSLVLVIMPGIVLASGGRIITSYLRVIKKPKYEIGSGILKMGALSLIALALYNYIGGIGVAIAVSLARIPWIIHLIYAYRKETGVPFRQLVVCKNDFKILYQKFLDMFPKTV